MHLPVEILHEIFQRVDYSSLVVKIPLACRRFRAIVKDGYNGGPLASNLFSETRLVDARQVLTSDEHAELHHKSHPMLMAMRIDFELLSSRLLTTDDINIMIRDGTPTKLATTLIANQNATSPPAIKLQVQVQSSSYGSHPVEIAGSGYKGFVTVLDVMSAVVDQLNALTAFKSRLDDLLEQLKHRDSGILRNLREHQFMFCRASEPLFSSRDDLPHLAAEVKLVQILSTSSFETTGTATSKETSDQSDERIVVIGFKLFRSQSMYTAVYEDRNTTVPVRYEEFEAA